MLIAPILCRHVKHLAYKMVSPELSVYDSLEFLEISSYF